MDDPPPEALPPPEDGLAPPELEPPEPELSDPEPLEPDPLEEPEEFPDPDPDEEDEDAEALVEVVFVGVVLAGAGVLAAELGTVRGGAPEVSAAVEPVPQAAIPKPRAEAAITATSRLKEAGRRSTESLRSRADPFACRSADSR